jgi:Tfp pilus assembly PilM family ATPase
MNATAGKKPKASGRLARLISWLSEPPVPLVAVEVRARTLGGVRMTQRGSERQIAAAAVMPLSEEAVSFSMMRPNVVEAESFRVVLRALLERIGALTEPRIALVLPDPVARIMVLPASEAPPPKGAAPEDVLRFRLRGKLPFDVREARLKEVALTSAGGRGASLVVAIHRAVLESYENACRQADLEPGLVEMCALALERSISAGSPAEDRLLINMDDRYTSLLLSRAGAPVLVRTLTSPMRLGDVVREVSSTLLYYRERLGGTMLTRAVLRSCALPTQEAVEVLSNPLGFAPEVIAPIESEETARLGAMVQALAGAAACLGVSP